MTTRLRPWHLTEKALLALAAQADKPARIYRGDLDELPDAPRPAGVAPAPEHPADRTAAVHAAVGRDRVSLTDEKLAAIRECRDRWKRTADMPDMPMAQRILNIGASANDVPPLLAEVQRLREHSITLNSVGWKLAQALGNVPADADQVEGNPIDLAERLIAELATKTEVAKSNRRAHDAMAQELATVTADRDRLAAEVTRLAMLIAAPDGSGIPEPLLIELLAMANHADNLGVADEALLDHHLMQSYRTAIESAWSAARESVDRLKAELAKPVRVVVVLDAVRGRIYSITASDNEAQQHVRELVAKHNGPNHAATMTVGLVDRPTPDAAPAMDADGWPVECQRPCRRLSTATLGSVELCDPWHGQPDPPVADAAAYLRDDQLCSDKAGFHDGHEYRPTPEDDIVWCPGLPEPERKASPAAADGPVA
jgi:hypothetical protein